MNETTPLLISSITSAIILGIIATTILIIAIKKISKGEYKKINTIISAGLILLTMLISIHATLEHVFPILDEETIEQILDITELFVALIFLFATITAYEYSQQFATKTNIFIQQQKARKHAEEFFANAKLKIKQELTGEELISKKIIDVEKGEIDVAKLKELGLIVTPSTKRQLTEKDYKHLIEILTTKLTKLYGSTAVEIANQITGLEVNERGQIKKIDKNAKKILTQLSEKYTDLAGDLSRMIVEERLRTTLVEILTK